MATESIPVDTAVIRALRGLHRRTTWTWTDESHAVVEQWSKEGCTECGIDRPSRAVGWPGPKARSDLVGQVQDDDEFRS